MIFLKELTGTMTGFIKSLVVQLDVWKLISKV